jgi:hypothetical protein
VISLDAHAGMTATCCAPQVNQNRNIPVIAVSMLTTGHTPWRVDYRKPFDGR